MGCLWNIICGFAIYLLYRDSSILFWPALFNWVVNGLAFRVMRKCHFGVYDKRYEPAAINANMLTTFIGFILLIVGIVKYVRS